MATNPQQHLSPEEYLRIDEQAKRASEYRNGVMVPIEDVTPQHSLLSANLSRVIGNALNDQASSACRLYLQPLRVYIPSNEQYTQPDVVIACDPKFRPPNTLTNPVVLIEILSPTTADYDRGSKFTASRTIPSLREYITVAQDRVHVEHFLLLDGHWTLIEHLDIRDTLRLLQDLDGQRTGRVIHISLADIYKNIDFAIG